ncbi:hypothetical protein Cha6605_5955 [Chamaesiphon minutus PCC 6605]|uniref:Uncharacterized protein n=1 Tax=Chamaesiphon minutus (strain ATCC 27169 / PCC 6605) TaxID=1173020 RepID=K9UQT9_CHAP6|nr:hypothetical protein Cha6605_5955 [Chamaesiphon minutus PCC 6605]
MVFFDLSLSNVIFPFLFLLKGYGRSKCRKGVTKIENVQNDELSAVRSMAATLIASARNILYLPIAPNNCNSEECLVRMPCAWYQRRWQYPLWENGLKLFGAIDASKLSGITYADAKMAIFKFRSRHEIYGNMQVGPLLRTGTLLSVSSLVGTRGC